MASRTSKILSAFFQNLRPTPVLQPQNSITTSAAASARRPYEVGQARSRTVVLETEQQPSSIPNSLKYDSNCLQPSSLPTFLGGEGNQKYYRGDSDKCRVTYYTGKPSNDLCRHQTVTFPYIIRQFSSKVSSKGCGKKNFRCVKKKSCKKGKCVKMILPDCECLTRDKCEHPYKAKKCKKINAPYKSYSELCAEDLDVDPSECVQCPWKRCPIDTTNKSRQYHTSACLLRDQVVATTSDALFDVRKKPCERPPPKCPPKKIEKQEKQKCIKPKTKKKCLNWTEAYSEYMIKNELDLDLARKDSDYEKFPFDENEAKYSHKRKRKCHITKNKWPGCEDTQKRKHKPIQDCPPTPCVDPKDAAMPFSVEYELARTPDCDESKKPKYPHVDKTMNADLYCKDCEDKKKKQERVPRDPCKKPKKEKGSCDKNVEKPKKYRGQDL